MHLAAQQPKLSEQFGIAPMVSKLEMRQHIADLAERHEIAVYAHVKRSAQAYSLREVDGAADEIVIAPIRSEITYATALHEIGHILGRYQTSPLTMVRERWAWQWARDNARVWTARMEREAKNSLAYYERKIRAGQMPPRLDLHARVLAR